MNTLHESALSLKLLHRGKVRDMYEVDATHLLIVTTDRLSAFDVILPDAIPNKGAVLTRVADFWFKHLQHIIPNQLANVDFKNILDHNDYAKVCEQAIVVKRLKPLPIEAIVRGYLIGSGWKDYQKTGQICGMTLPEGLQLAEKLPTAIFTPSTKAAMGSHDENIDFAQMVALIGENLATQVRDTALALYTAAAAYAKTRGILIADTKFEFGVDENGVLHLIDEVLTPDSSRFWPEDQYQVGISPPSFDKQFVRDYLESLPDWNKQAPAPTLPADVIAKTTEKYLEAEKRLLG